MFIGYLYMFSGELSINQAFCVFLIFFLLLYFKELIVAYIVCDFHIFILLFVVFLLCLLCSYVFFKGLLVRYLVHFELILVCGVSSFACTSPVFPGALAESSYFAFFVECF